MDSNYFYVGHRYLAISTNTYHCLLYQIPADTSYHLPAQTGALVYFLLNVDQRQLA